MALPEALLAVRSLVCLATIEMPHERLFQFSRRAITGTSLPSWLLTPGPVLLRRFVRRKDDRWTWTSRSEPVLRWSAHFGLEGKFRLFVGSCAAPRISCRACWYSPWRGFWPCALDCLPTPWTPTWLWMAVDMAPADSPATSPRHVPLRRSTRIRRPPDRYGDGMV